MPPKRAPVQRDLGTPIPGPSSDPPPSAPTPSTPEQGDDDICSICRDLIYRPYITRQCDHSFCETCWMRIVTDWAHFLAQMPEYPKDLLEHLPNNNLGLTPLNDPDVHESKWRRNSRYYKKTCPICKNLTSVRFDVDRHNALQKKYRSKYDEARQRKEAEPKGELNLRKNEQLCAIYIGNSCKESLKGPGWRVFTMWARPSRPEIVEEVTFQLHPTFIPPRVIARQDPWEFTRIGWARFTVIVCITLKPGWEFTTGKARDVRDGQIKGIISLEWKIRMRLGHKTNSAGLRVGGKQKKVVLGVRRIQNWKTNYHPDTTKTGHENDYPEDADDQWEVEELRQQRRGEERERKRKEQEEKTAKNDRKRKRDEEEKGEANNQQKSG